ncbi:golgi uridine diphosphate-N- acetylglucosamine transporter [Aspergillus nanangensis]|uniref:Golgi uridine diphosphate-N- acetylglucosamine transporter n=1 Tax=Aspergillus nanangensis TaxID=2582783 RepID=A0AAD4GVH6_ASPNN|nr:golgi uridine diphosphate-N- acetylglucosamine transporter [Aspergillus nanangensis]
MAATNSATMKGSTKDSGRHDSSSSETDSASLNSNRDDMASSGAQSLSHASLANIATAAAYATVPSWANVLLMVSLIFGGCCANVFALEAIIKDQPTSGPLITFAQFVITSLFTAPTFISLSQGPKSLFLAQRVIPLRSWLVYTAFFVTVNLLNNWAFAYKISVPLHIILRSGGPVASMLVGYIYNRKRYSPGQILSVAMLTVGVVAAAMADAQARGQSLNLGNSDSDSTVASAVIGFTILALAMVLSAFQGVYADRLYETYGRNNWKEALFYSHILSLPIFLPTYAHLSTQWRALTSSSSLLSRITSIATKYDHALESVTSIAENASAVLPWEASIASTVGSNSQLSMISKSSQALGVALASVPMGVFYLSMNALTQYLCIRGVHLLSAKSSSLTVTIVLNIRKLVSLMLSIRLFGNQLASGVLLGAFFVFIGGALYGFEGARLRKVRVKQD